MSSSLIREAGGESTVLAEVTVPVSWMWTLWSGMVSSTWMGVVFFQLHSKISALQTGASFTFRYEITPNSPDKPPLLNILDRVNASSGSISGQYAPGCEEKIDAEFVRWILHDGRTKQKWAKMERIGEKYPEKYVLIRNQRELDGFLKEL